tara:strand:- start:52 stop:774 length:723 start_codon:yes stop_codon:yes gene_type:complete
MNILLISIVIIVLVLILLTFKNKELFYQDSTSCIGLKIQKPQSREERIGFHTRVYPNDPTKYDDFFGPTCLNTCLIEHIPKINLKSISENLNSLDNDGKKNIFNWNHSNPDKYFCHSANILDTTNNIKKCTGECQNKCEKKGNELDENGEVIEDSEFDYSLCKIKRNVCAEESNTSNRNNMVNYLSGGAILNSTRCAGNFENNEKGCVNKYFDNIETIKQIYDNYTQNIINRENENIRCV